MGVFPGGASYHGHCLLYGGHQQVAVLGWEVRWLNQVVVGVLVIMVMEVMQVMEVATWGSQR